MSEITIVIYILWIILIISFLISSLYYFILYNKVEDDLARKRITRLVAIFFLFLALSRLFHLLAYVRHGGFENFNAGYLSLEVELLFTLSQIFIFMGMILIIFYFENQLKRDNLKVYTIFNTLICGIYFSIKYTYIFNVNNHALAILEFITSYILNFIIALFGLILSLMYLKISLKTSGVVMRKAFFIFLGFLLLLSSYALAIFEDFVVIDIELIYILSFLIALISIPFLIFGYN
ncbi:MAG: hypothetical protein ACTSR8_14760 [Promethearchaeota archaeon]